MRWSLLLPLALLVPLTACGDPAPPPTAEPVALASTASDLPKVIINRTPT